VLEFNVLCPPFPAAEVVCTSLVSSLQDDLGDVSVSKVEGIIVAINP
jgi:hypothetical protein